MRWFLAGALTTCLLVGCAALLAPREGVIIAGHCAAKPQRTVRAPGLIFHTADCYACSAESQGCYFDGNHYCCKDIMCSECDHSPFEKKAPSDGGVEKVAGLGGAWW